MPILHFSSDSTDGSDRILEAHVVGPRRAQIPSPLRCSAMASGASIARR